MATIVTRAGKGSPLTHTEVDANFTNLNTDKIESGNTVASLTITSADINGGTVDNAAIGNSTPAAGTFTTLTGNSTSQFGRSSANYIQAVGAATTLSPELSVLGSDTNIPFTIESKGTGAVNLAGGSRGVNISNGGTVTAITRTAAGGSYTSFPSVAITAPTTAGGVQATATVAAMLAGNPTTVQAGGTGYTLNDTLTVVGGTPSVGAATYTVTGVSGGVVTSVTALNFAQYTTLPTNPVSTTGGTGTGCTLNLTYGVAATNPFTITNAGSGYVEQPTVTFSGGGGSGASAVAVVGSATSIKSLNDLTFNLPSGPILSLADSSNPGTGGYLQLTNGSATNSINRAFGTGTNIGIYWLSKGTGSHSFATNNSTATEQLRVAHTASAVNYVQVTGAATTNTPNISAQGSDTNIPIYITSKGTGTVRFFTNGAGSEQFRVLHTAGTIVNYATVTGSITNTAPVFSVAGSDTNIDLNLTTKGTGALNVIANGATQFKVGETAITNAVNYISIFGGVTGAAPRLLVRGSDTNINLLYSTKGSGEHVFRTNETNNDQFRITHTASSVNYVQVTGAATGASPTISAQGSDSNIQLTLQSKGTSAIALIDGSSSTIMRGLRAVASGDTFLDIRRDIGFVDLIAASGVTDGDIRFTPKGAGRVRFGTRTATSDVAITGYIEIKDSGGTTRKLAIID